MKVDELSNGTVRVQFDNAKSANAFGVDAARELARIAKNPKLKALIFTGEGRFFCSGGDLKKYRALKTKADGVKLNREIAKNLRSLSNAPVAKIALVNGDCLGGGLEVLSCFDFVFAQPEAIFGFWQTRQKLSYGWGGFARLSQRIGAHSSKTALLVGLSVSSYEAKRIGIVDQIFSKEEIGSATLEFANSVSEVKAYHKINTKNESLIFEDLWRKKTWTQNS